MDEILLALLIALGLDGTSLAGSGGGPQESDGGPGHEQSGVWLTER